MPGLSLMHRCLEDSRLYYPRPVDRRPKHHFLDGPHCGCKGVAGLQTDGGFGVREGRPVIDRAALCSACDAHLPRTACQIMSRLRGSSRPAARLRRGVANSCINC
jgi:hypothetical protein